MQSSAISSILLDLVRDVVEYAGFVPGYLVVVVAIFVKYVYCPVHIIQRYNSTVESPAAVLSFRRPVTRHVLINLEQAVLLVPFLDGHCP